MSFDATTVTVSAAAGPFEVTQPNTAVSWTGGASATVSWNVANTDAAPVSCAAVKIELSLDGGLTFPTLLATTDNDGGQVVAAPAVANQEDAARIRVACADNVFFDVSNASFTIVPSLFSDGFESGDESAWSPH
jgi:hypothetical protein